LANFESSATGKPRLRILHVIISAVVALAVLILLSSASLAIVSYAATLLALSSRETSSPERVGFPQLQEVLRGFARELSRGLSPEQAWENASREFGADEEEVFRQVNANLMRGIPFEKAISYMGCVDEDQEAILEMARAILARNSLEAGGVLEAVLRRNAERHFLREEMRSVLKALWHKAKILTMLTSMILGCLVGLIPLLASYSLSLSNIPQAQSLHIDFLAHISAAISLYLIALSSAHFSHEIVSQKTPLSFYLLCTLVYWGAAVLSTFAAKTISPL